ncbi:xanthine and CO dehydrogenases maturation factor, XdhC/CoxF family [Sphaerochaeta pleomorpha str. Grapes]|uniref:Xanthine and CO dehydrogenases maturation factor, XdhC/CoxF family n=2 Tax=Sphaerochaeta TaxID=399320 RepID=G8QT42_SPHPG|nr:xanthine and CO dehydrogenases maturation factor, XdhC/CoxF family [Sphaerochaeta pleomorpha str. Grapes]
MENYYNTMLKALQTGNIVRKTIVSGPYIGDEALYRGNAQIATYQQTPHSFDTGEVLSETLGAKVHLVLCGGGHVAKELYALAVLMDMEVSILDEREEFCNKELYPKADLHCAPFLKTLTEKQTWVKPYYVLVTRGHGFDQVCLEQTLGLPHSYIGMIGSKNKVKITLDNLRKKGFSEDLLATVHSPIGLSIGAITASEIAISIMAEIISVYRKEEKAVRLDPKLLEKLSQSKGYILARVIEKTGSAPCDVGFQIAIFADGTTSGTVGGGMVEAKTIEHAQEMLSAKASRAEIIHYNLDSSKAGSLGMICGGDAKILFQVR